MQDSFLNFEEDKDNIKQHVALALKYRSQTFADLIGQDVVIRTLRNAFINNCLHHAFIFNGIRGTGKTTTARLIAKAVNCLNPIDQFEPCNVCENCLAITDNRHPDVLELDAASNTSVDNIRDIVTNAQFRPVIAAKKVFIIDEAHMLSKSAFNALLKTLEEPPENVIFILATTEMHKIPMTIISRCQRFDLKRVSNSELAAHFKKIAGLESASIDDESLRIISIAAKGSVRDGISILDQAIALGNYQVRKDLVIEMLGLANGIEVLNILKEIISDNIQNALAISESVYLNGGDPLMIAEETSKFIHHITKIKVLSLEDNQLLNEEEWKICKELSKQADLIFLNRAWQMMQKAIEDIAHSSLPKEELEMALIRLSIANTHITPEEMLRKISTAQSSIKIEANNSNSSKADIILNRLRTSFEYSLLVEYMLEKNEAMLYHNASVYTKFCSFENNVLKIAILSEAPQSLRKDIEKFAKSYYKPDIVVSLNDDNESGFTLMEEKQNKISALKKEIISDNLVQDIISEFSGNISEVRVKEENH